MQCSKVSILCLYYTTAAPKTPTHDILSLIHISFLASTDGVELSIHFNKKLGAGFFGGEGFIMQRLSGTGMAFVEIDGELVEYTLEPGQKLIVDTGNVAGFDTTVDLSLIHIFQSGHNIYDYALTPTN